MVFVSVWCGLGDEYRSSRHSTWSLYSAGERTIEGNIGTTAETGTTPHAADEC